MNIRVARWGLAVATASFFGTAGAAGITVYEQDEQYVKLGGRIQIQYHQISPDGGEETDELFLRRFRPYVIGSLHKGWKGKLQWEMGKAKGVVVKEAYMLYTGFGGGKLYLGNMKSGFSREMMTSSKKQQLVERTFVGDHNYGVPEYLLGLRFNGLAADKRIGYIVSFGSMSFDPDDKKLDFDTPVNKDSDWNEGWVAAGRIDYYPFGYFSMSQGDFGGGQKLAVGLGAFTWSNDGDNNTYTDAAGNHTGGSKADVDNANGGELSVAYRYGGFSMDAQYNVINASAVDGTYAGGVFDKGETTLTQMALEGGYMVIPSTLELVAGFESMDADGYKEVWTRSSVGINWFLHKHDIKTQLTYRQGKNLYGKSGDDGDELFLQAQYVF